MVPGASVAPPGTLAAQQGGGRESRRCGGAQQEPSSRVETQEWHLRGHEVYTESQGGRQRSEEGCAWAGVQRAWYRGGGVLQKGRGLPKPRMSRPNTGRVRILFRPGV